MYKGNIVTIDNLKIIYFTQALTCSEKIPGFIHELDGNPKTWNTLTKFEKWHPVNEGVVDETVCYGLVKTANPYVMTDDESLNNRLRYIVNSITAGMDFCSEIYSNTLRIEPIEYPSTFTIRKYDTGYEMGPHSDTYTGSKDFGISAVVYLNDNYEGGELSFPEYNVKLKPEAGSIVMFPSNTVHEALAVTKGEKYFAPFFSK